MMYTINHGFMGGEPGNDAEGTVIPTPPGYYVMFYDPRAGTVEAMRYPVVGFFVSTDNLTVMPVTLMRSTTDNPHFVIVDPDGVVHDQHDEHTSLGIFETQLAARAGKE